MFLPAAGCIAPGTARNRVGLLPAQQPSAAGSVRARGGSRNERFAAKRCRFNERFAAKRCRFNERFVAKRCRCYFDLN